MTPDHGARPRDGSTEPERVARLEAIVERLEVSVGEMRAEQARMGAEQARMGETLARLEVLLAANTKLLERAVRQLATVTERIDATIADNARRNDATNRRVDWLLYGMWGLAAVWSGALAALIAELLSR